MTATGELTIGELAARSGVAPSALRFYEQRGLISAARMESGHRRYTRPTIRRVAFIVFAQRVGLTLAEIGEELERLPTDRVPTSDDWAQLTGTWEARIDERIDELQRLRDSLTGCIGCGCLSLERCALVNPDDRLGRVGPGPRLWVGQAGSIGGPRPR
ncbi:redox-sensitive transcriptional activator SoxR [Patulibacter brassicae]|uniref:Redox-sensitive transcriptional activator SoxR n=1 Tax=Patulibacter brassicae TaxID=1705717 RepID=A0ABU4VSH5_9ACTN|nr:redox-sensitive transcriptional activator SoxR [Patulibacter brassicae]MDX8153843.1 redox-sensitive transcriptional activator SoxR [Patulibacter brassicae]